MLDNYMWMIGTLPKEVITPLIKGDHPELDATSELDVNGIKKYRSLIGSLQWVVTLGRLDIAVAVMTLSSFRAAPREGHLERAKRIYGYLRKMKHAGSIFELVYWITHPFQMKNMIGKNLSMVIWKRACHMMHQSVWSTCYYDDVCGCQSLS